MACWPFGRYATTPCGDDHNNQNQQSNWVTFRVSVCNWSDLLPTIKPTEPSALLSSSRITKGSDLLSATTQGNVWIFRTGVCITTFQNEYEWALPCYLASEQWTRYWEYDLFGDQNCKSYASFTWMDYVKGSDSRYYLYPKVCLNGSSMEPFDPFASLIPVLQLSRKVRSISDIWINQSRWPLYITPGIAAFSTLSAFENHYTWYAASYPHG